MDAVSPLRFQPTIVVCVAPEAHAVRDELALLLPGIDAHRQAGIAFLMCEGKHQAVTETAQINATEDPGAEQDPRAPVREGPLLGTRFVPDAGDVLESVVLEGPGARTARQEERAEERLLTTLVVEALRGRRPRQGRAHTVVNTSNSTSEHQTDGAHLGVLDDKIIQRIIDDGYTVPNAQAVVWIVASPQSPFLEDVMRDVRRALDSEGIRGKVLLALANIYDSDVETRAYQAEVCRSQPWNLLLDVGDTADRSASHHQRRLADFAYLFEERDEQGLFWNDQDIAFAIAEMIFILMTTEIVGGPAVGRLLQSSLPHLLTSPLERIGGVGTSRLTFPRSHIELYCASRMAARIVSDWVSKTAESAALKDGNKDQMQSQNDAARWVERVQGKTKTETVDTNAVISWLRAHVATRATYTRYPTDLDQRLIFRFFSVRELGELETERNDVGTVLSHQYPRAWQGFIRWRTSVRRYWREYEQKMLEELNALTKNDVLMGAGGVENVRAFFERLDIGLADAKEYLAMTRERREERYANFLSDYDARGRIGSDGARGPWMDLLSERSIETNNPNDAIRPAQPMAQRLDPSQLEVSPNELQQAQETQNQGDVEPEPVSREDQIIRQLEARYRWERTPRQAIAPVAPRHIAPGALLATPPTTLLTVMLLSGWLPLLATPLGIAGLAVGIFALLNFGGRAFMPHPHESPTVQSARTDLINFYRLLFRYRMTVVEDSQRESLVIGLHADVRDSLDRLVHWEEFVAGLENLLDKRASMIEARLFEGSIGRRDILVANRHELRRDRYGLPDLEGDITQRRREHPKLGKEWHASNAEITRRLREAPLEGVSLLRSSPEQIVRPLFVACRSIVTDYLDGPIADISLALKALPANEQSGLLNRLVTRALILYYPEAPSRYTPLIFICVRDQDRLYLKESALTSGATAARIQDQDWLGTIRMTHGGGAPSFWALQGSLPVNLPTSPTWTNLNNRTT